MNTRNYFNYFKYHKRKRTVNLSTKYIAPIAVMAVLVCGILFGYYYIQLKSYEYQVDLIASLNNNTSFTTQYNEVSTLDQMTAQVDSDIAYLQYLESDSLQRNTTSQKVIDYIYQYVTEGMSITSININSLSVSISGSAPTSTHVTKLLADYRASGMVSDPYIDSLSPTPDDGTGETSTPFSISMTIIREKFFPTEDASAEGGEGAVEGESVEGVEGGAEGTVEGETAASESAVETDVAPVESVPAETVAESVEELVTEVAVEEVPAQ